MILKQNAVVPFFKFGGNQVAEGLASRDFIAGEADVAADLGRLGQKRGIGPASGDAEGDQRRRMRMKHRLDVGTELVDVAVEGKFAGRLVNALDRAVGLDAYDVLGTQRALVHAAGADPHVALVVEDGKVAAGGGCHAVSVKAFHDKGDEIARVHHFKIHDRLLVG